MFWCDGWIVPFYSLEDHAFKAFGSKNYLPVTGKLEDRVKTRI